MLPGRHYRTGRLPHDPARVAAVQGHAYGAIEPPAACVRSLDRWTPGMYDNDSYGDCTAASLANHARAAAIVRNDADIIVADGAPLAFYAACLGMANATPDQLAATDGAQMLDVLEYTQAHGYEVGEQVPLVPTILARVDPTDRSGLANVIAREGAVYAGVDLYESDMNAVPSTTWDVGSEGNLVGGHALLLYAYEGLADSDIVTICTWGMFRPATWRWVKARLMEAYSLQWPQYS